ncbi:MAG: lysophospholipid acyltransferase family protein [Betaproteobacteria bacterium]
MHRLLSAVLRAAARLPLGVLHAVGTVLGWAIYGISPTYRRHLRENLARAGYTDAATRRAAIVAAGQMLAEIPAVWFSPPERIERLVTRVEGDAPAMAALGEGKAVLFLTPHMGCFEVAAQYAALRAPITVLYRPPKLAWLDPLMREGRVRDNVRLVPADLSGVRELFNAVRRGEAVGFLPDQVPGLGEGEWAELFGAPAYTMTLAAKLAQRDNVACFLAYAKRLPGGTGYEILVRRFPEALLNESPARRLNRAIESLVRECPAQYLWGYNRYKVPAGAEPPK